MTANENITIHKPTGVDVEVCVGAGSRIVANLMQDDYVKLVFDMDTVVRLETGSWIEVEGKRYVLNQKYNPSYDTATGGYHYELQLDAWYYGWKRYMFSLVPAYGCVQTTFNYTNNLLGHLILIFEQLQHIAYEGDSSVVIPAGVFIHYNGHTDRYDWDSDALVLEDEEATEPVPETSNEYTYLVTEDMKSVAYSGVNINDAISAMCAEEAFNCEWWVDENYYLHFGRCEYGEAVELVHHDDFEDLQRSESSDEYGTRLVAFGSSRNVPSRYRKKLVFEASNVHTANGWTHFTDSFRKVPINVNTGSKRYSSVASASIPHSQTEVIGHEYIDVLSETKTPTVKNNYYLGRKTTTWQKRDYYDCVEKFNHYYDYRIATYQMKAGDKVVIKGEPVVNESHYLYQYRNNGWSTSTVSDFITSDGRVELEVRADQDATIRITLSGTIQVEYYESTQIAYHRLVNSFPTLQQGRYRVYIDHAEFLNQEFRINGEFRCNSNDQYVDIEVYEEGQMTWDVVNDNSQYVDSGGFEIDIENLDYYQVATKIHMIDGTSHGKTYNAYLNMSETSVNNAPALPLSKDSFHLSILGLSTGIRNGDHFTIEGFNLLDVPLSYFTDDYAVNTNIASYERRLMLPVDRCPGNYIDSDRIQRPADIVTVVKIFDEIYPSQTLSVALVETYTERVQKTDDNGSTYYEDATRYRFFIRKSDLDFKMTYLASGQSLEGRFQDGLLGGLTFGLEFEGATQKRDDAGNELQAYAIVNNGENGIDLPNKTICPRVGDRLVLLNYNPMSLQDMGLVADAEERLYNAAKAYLDKISLDSGTYTVNVLTSAAEAKEMPTIGRKAVIRHEAYFEEPRATRVIGYELNLDIPWDSPVIRLGESLRYSRLGAIESKLKR